MNLGYKSPGVSFKEEELLNGVRIDPELTVALMGYAQKGPSDEFKLISDTRDLISTFGDVTKVTKSLYTAQKVLENGGNVFFKRIVDTTTAKQAVSNVFNFSLVEPPVYVEIPYYTNMSGKINLKQYVGWDVASVTKVEYVQDTAYKYYDAEDTEEHIKSSVERNYVNTGTGNQITFTTGTQELNINGMVNSTYDETDPTAGNPVYNTQLPNNGVVVKVTLTLSTSPSIGTLSFTLNTKYETEEYNGCVIALERFEKNKYSTDIKDTYGFRIRLFTITDSKASNNLYQLIENKFSYSGITYQNILDGKVHKPEGSTDPDRYKLDLGDLEITFTGNPVILLLPDSSYSTTGDFIYESEINGFKKTGLLYFNTKVWFRKDSYDTGSQQVGNQGGPCSHAVLTDLLKKSLSKLDNTNLYTFATFAVPDLWGSYTGGADVSEVKIFNEVVFNLAEERGDFIYVMDLPDDTDMNNIESKLFSITGWSPHYQGSAFVTTYMPYVTINYNNLGQLRVPCSCVVIPTYTRNDRNSYSWFAPAGIQNTRGLLSNVVAIDKHLSKADRDNIYDDFSINPIVFFSNYGTCLWGNRTLAVRNNWTPESAFTALNVRRLCNYIRRQVTDISFGEIFNPNDEGTWFSWETKVTSLLNHIKDNRGIEDFRVVTGRPLITDEDIQYGRMPAQIYIKPIRALEFISITLFVTYDNTYFTSEEG